jgi:hypothetical protein
VIAAFLLLAAVQQAVAPSPLDWYGARIGEAPPPGQGEPADRVWPLPNPRPPPWEDAQIFVDGQGRIASIELSEPMFVLQEGPRPAHPRPGPDHRPKYDADGRAAEAYAVARLGPPTHVERYQDGPYQWSDLHWDFVARFIRCDGATPVFAAPSHERTGRIARAELQYRPSGVELEIVGNAADEIVQSNGTEHAGRADECRSRAREAEEATRAEERARQRWVEAVLYCRDHSDLCSLLPGTRIVLGAGVMILSRPCPPGAAPGTVCFETRPVERPRAP